MHWVPVHVGIAGNEAVDALAKESALGASSPLSSHIIPFEHPLPTSRVAAIAVGTKAFNARWLEEWNSLPCSHRLALFDDAKPSRKVARMYAGLSRPQCSMLTQLRTTHVGLNVNLYRFHLAPSP
ncbi:hypothetical protein B0H10DRAFT_1819767 [Mycena sp. CBHHK59/15]|nr:hypothetical protein B0H10DRAFT_1819767 [Mycena sp. CBHHK59/15]